MATIAVVRRPPKTARSEAQPRLGWRGETITVGLGLTFLTGVLVDGWAHFHLRLTETFFTPWHGLLYSGYVLCALWLFLVIARFQRLGWTGLAALPRGYELSFAGILLFGLSGLADMLWHVAFGIETDLSAALSPTHLGLYTSGALILSGPLCAAWKSDTSETGQPSLVAWLPRLLSLAGSTAAVAYMHAYLWAFNQTWPLRDQASAYALSPEAAALLRAVGDGRGVASILITNLIVLGPVLLLLRRWRLPFGSVSLILVVVTLLMTIQPGLSWGTGLTLARALVTGLIVDALIALIKPGPGDAGALRIVAGVMPVVVWSLYFLGAQLHWGLAWPPELVLGVITLTGLSGFGLSILMLPPAGPGGSSALSSGTSG